MTVSFKKVIVGVVVVASLGATAAALNISLNSGGTKVSTDTNLSSSSSVQNITDDMDSSSSSPSSDISSGSEAISNEGSSGTSSYKVGDILVTTASSIQTQGSSDTGSHTSAPNGDPYPTTEADK